MWGLQRAIADGVNTIMEFGGGIGKDQPGAIQPPASRKPNLEGITRKSQRATGRDGLYLPAINSGSLRQAAKILRTLQETVAAPQDDLGAGNVGVDEKWFRLFVPVRDGIVNHSALELSMQLGEMGLNKFVRTFSEPYEQSIQILQTCCDTDISDAQPYLEVIFGGTTGAVLHYRGDDINRELCELRETLERRSHKFAIE